MMDEHIFVDCVVTAISKVEITFYDSNGKKFKAPFSEVLNPNIVEIQQEGLQIGKNWVVKNKVGVI